MPVQVREFQETPNPNAVKCILEGAGSDAPAVSAVRSYRTPPSRLSPPLAGTSGDPVAEALFAIPGVSAVLIAEGWITINKVPTASWSTIKPAVKSALAKFEHTKVGDGSGTA